MQVAIKFKIPEEKVDFTMEVLNNFPFVENAEVIDFSDYLEKKDVENKALFRKNIMELAGKGDLSDIDLDVTRGRKRGAELHRRFMCMD